MSLAINQNITNIANPNANIAQKPAPKGGFCNWVRENKTTIAIALLILGIGALTAGIGLLAGALSGGVAGLMTLTLGTKGPVFVLSLSGKLAVAGASAALGGLAFTSFSSGMLAGIPSARV